MSFHSPVYVVDGARTPFLKEKKQYGPWTASDLAVQCSNHLLNKLNFDASIIDEVVTGCAMPNEDEANIARIIALRLGCGIDTPAYTVMRNCASGMQAVHSACESILTGRSHCVLAIGTEAMSRAPLFYNENTYHWFVSGRTAFDKVKNLFKMKPNFLKPVIALKHGLTDPLYHMMMGQTAEEIAHHFGITKEQMNEFSVQSHKKAAKAWEDGAFEEVCPLMDYKNGKVVIQDDGIRADSSVEKLGKLKPVFEKYGNITVGNSSQITDGAGALLLVSEHLVEKYNLSPLGKITAQSWTGCDPKVMGLGPVKSMAQIMLEKNYTCDDIDFFEINEAFAAQVMGCVQSFARPELAKRFSNLEQDLGVIDEQKLNIHGGSVALGHPIGASGVRIILRSLYQLRQQNKQKALASLCIGGGQGGATLVEAV